MDTRVDPTPRNAGRPNELLKQLQDLLAQQSPAAAPAAAPQLTPELLAAAQQLLAQQQAAQTAASAAPAAQDPTQVLAQLQQLLGQQAAAQPAPAVAPQPLAAAPAPQQFAAAPQQFAAAPPAGPKKGKGGLIAGLTALVLVAGGAFGFTGFVTPGFLLDSGPAENEIFLESAADIGRSPFSEQSLAAAPNTALAPAPTPAATPVTTVATTTVSGGEAGLYGGSLNIGVCDPTKLVNFLAANPDKAGAWVAALNADPTVKLQDGSALTTAHIGAYVAGLTTVVLASDTRVTNHGYKNGKPYTINSVLQKGTAVLVDDKGIARVKCNCGNPLLPPKAVPGTPVVTGDPWPDYDPNQILRVEPSPEPIYVFVLVDIDSLLAGNPTYIERIVGSSGQGGDVVNDGTDPNAEAAAFVSANPPSPIQNPAFSIDIPTLGLELNADAQGGGDWASAPSIELGDASSPGTFVPTGGDTPVGTQNGYYTGAPAYVKVTYLNPIGADPVARLSEPDPGYPAECQPIIEPVTVAGWVGVKRTTVPCRQSWEDLANPGQWYGGWDTPRVQYGLVSPQGDALSITFRAVSDAPLLTQVLRSFSKN